jgi:hypothetical protein
MMGCSESGVAWVGEIVRSRAAEGYGTMSAGRARPYRWCDRRSAGRAGLGPPAMLEISTARERGIAGRWWTGWKRGRVGNRMMWRS